MFGVLLASQKESMSLRKRYHIFLTSVRTPSETMTGVSDRQDHTAGVSPPLVPV